jgi:hypothetical protein
LGGQRLVYLGADDSDGCRCARTAGIIRIAQEDSYKLVGTRRQARRAEDRPAVSVGRLRPKKIVIGIEGDCPPGEWAVGQGGLRRHRDRSCTRDANLRGGRERCRCRKLRYLDVDRPSSGRCYHRVARIADCDQTATRALAVVEGGKCCGPSAKAAK